MAGAPGQTAAESPGNGQSEGAGHGRWSHGHAGDRPPRRGWVRAGEHLGLDSQGPALGVRWVEVDARLSRDRHLILFHDDALERTTNGRGWVADTDLSLLKALDAGGWFGEAFRGERIPTLEEALMAFRELGLGANIEIKPDRGREKEPSEAVGQALNALWSPNLPRAIISSFREDAPRAHRRTELRAGVVGGQHSGRLAAPDGKPWLSRAALRGAPSHPPSCR